MFPLIVKPLQADASAGICRPSIVQDMAALADRVSFIHERFGRGAIAEEFVDGRELYVGQPLLSYGHDMAYAAAKAGMEYSDFIQRIVDVAVGRYERA